MVERGKQNPGPKVGFEVEPVWTLQILFFLINFQGSLEEIQGILNTTEISLHQLTALVDCRSLHMVSSDEKAYEQRHSYCRVTIGLMGKGPGDWFAVTSL